MNIDTLIKQLQEKEKKENELRDYYVGSSDDGDYDDECRVDFNQYRCKGCRLYDTCFNNEIAAEVDARELHRAMQGEPLEKIFGGTHVEIEETEIITDNDVPF